jgi:hypothetical protein
MQEPGGGRNVPSELKGQDKCRMNTTRSCGDALDIGVTHPHVAEANSGTELQTKHDILRTST